MNERRDPSIHPSHPLGPGSGPSRPTQTSLTRNLFQLILGNPEAPKADPLRLDILCMKITIGTVDGGQHPPGTCLT